jgi:Ni/Co efflux regulator RcnB
MIMKLIVPAAIASLVGVTSAWAQPPASTSMSLAQSTPPGFAQVQGGPMRRDGDTRRADNRADDREHFAPGRRYDKSPAGWRRHGYRRPGDWRTRGCVTAGPIWFCP